jgi:hypothetical protein
LEEKWKAVNPLDDVSVDWNLIPKFALEKNDGKTWIGFVSFRLMASGGSL